MDKFRLAFTDAEEALVAQIDFGGDHKNHGDQHNAYLANQEPILALLASLGERNAVPAHRLSYWSDPQYNPGRVKGSRKQMFERNGNKGKEIYTHPGFITHLRYILFGANLPAAVVAAFEEEVGNPEWVSYGDALELGKFARSLVRRHGLEPHAACEEFFRLSLDLGLSLDEALRIRQSVKETR
jgi:hypothetical protein